MRYIALVLFLVLFLGAAQAYPLQGGDKNVKANLFGVTRIPLEDQNATEEILKLDIGLLGAENATYELVNSTGAYFQPGLYKNLQPGRYTLFFLVPKDDLFKLIRVTPSGGSPFNINWWSTPKASDKDLIIRYYGITDWIWDPDQQAVVMEMRIGNNGTSSRYIGPENFTLLDQWGWPYHPVVGFEPMVIEPQMATGRIKIGFTGISLLSRPSVLAYNYGETNQLAIDLEKDAGPLSDAQVYGENASSASKAASPAPANVTSVPATATVNQTNETQGTESLQNQTTERKMLSLKDEINASKERLKGVNQGSSAGDQGSTVGKKINSSVEETKERLAMARERLKENNSST